MRIEFGSNTPQLQQDLESIVANPDDALNPALALRCSVLAYTAKVHSSRRAAGCSQSSAAGSRPRRRGEQAPAGGDPPGIVEAEPASAAADELEHPPPADSEQPDLADANRADPALDAALLEEGVPADEGVVREEGAALGAPGEADATINLAQEEEAPEQDEYVEVEVDSETLSIYKPLPPSGDEADVLVEEPSSSTAPATVGSGSLSSRTPLVLRPRQPGYSPVRIDREGTWVKVGEPEPVHPPVPAPAYPNLPHEAADPHSLPDSAWLDPASFARTHSTAGIRLGIPHYKLEAAPEVLPQTHRVPDAGSHQRLPSQRHERQRAEGCSLRSAQEGATTGKGRVRTPCPHFHCKAGWRPCRPLHIASLFTPGGSPRRLGRRPSKQHRQRQKHLAHSSPSRLRRACLQRGLPVTSVHHLRCLRAQVLQQTRGFQRRHRPA